MLHCGAGRDCWEQVLFRMFPRWVCAEQIKSLCAESVARGAESEPMGPGAQDRGVSGGSEPRVGLCCSTHTIPTLPFQGFPDCFLRAAGAHSHRRSGCPLLSCVKELDR